MHMAGNLGFITYLVADACFTFVRRDRDGRPRSAAPGHARSLANLHGEHYRAVTEAAMLAAMNESA